jgi:hypothetical protein
VTPQNTVRHDRELASWFKEEQGRWKRHEIRLIDFKPEDTGDVDDEHWKTRDDGVRVPLWYPRPLGTKVISDKAAIFEKVGWWPSQPQCLLHASNAHIKLFEGGSRAGKSVCGAHEVAPLLLTPGTNGWIVAPEYDQGKKEMEYLLAATVHHPFVKASLKAAGATVLKARNKPKQGDMEIRIRFAGGFESFAQVKSARHLDSLLSEELDWMLIAEAPLIREEAWHRQLQPRMINRHGIVVIPASPKGRGWVNELKERAEDGEWGYFFVNADMRTNPVIDQDAASFWTKHMTGADYDEQVLGKAAAKHGIVYSGFRREIHCDAWQSDWPKKSWVRGRSVDFGWTNPFVFLWIAADEDGRLYVYREWYRTQQLYDAPIRYIADVEGWQLERDSATGYNKLSGRHGVKEKIQRGTIMDHDAQGRGELRARGLLGRRADKDVEEGIKDLQAMLNVQRDGRPRLFVNRRACPNLCREFRNYEWAEDERPKKDQEDHALDALRYYVRTLYRRQVKRGRFARRVRG